MSGVLQVGVTLRNHPWHECRRVGRIVAGPAQRINALGRARVYWSVQWEGRPASEWVAGARLQATSGDDRRCADG